MSEAPGRFTGAILRHDSAPKVYVVDIQIGGFGEVETADYIRADLAGLPEDLVERLRRVKSGVDGWSLTTLEEDILAWHEQQTGGGE